MFSILRAMLIRYTTALGHKIRFLLLAFAKRIIATSSRHLDVPQLTIVHQVTATALKSVHQLARLLTRALVKLAIQLTQSILSLVMPSTTA